MGNDIKYKLFHKHIPTPIRYKIAVVITQYNY